jgi:16S rRNA (uracil1498-N3)-methyltransferase
MPRFFCPAALEIGHTIDLPTGPARHVQVLRLQPGDAITLFNNGPGWLRDAKSAPGGEFTATVTQMGRSQVQVHIDSHEQVERENQRAIYLAVGMPANDRMDWLVEKATELGVAGITPLMTERSVLRLSGERAEKKVAHWQSVAIAACEQCGGNRIPIVAPLVSLTNWLKASPNEPKTRLLLSLREGSTPLRMATNNIGPDSPDIVFLSGPEGGLSAIEESSAADLGFVPVSLGARVLRAETAALAALTLLAG